MNGIMYVLSTGCQWRSIPKDSAAAQHAFDYLDLWTLRRHAGSHPSRALCGVPRARRAGSHPTACVIDSQSVKALKKGAASIRMAMMQAKKIKVRSAIFS